MKINDVSIHVGINTGKLLGKNSKKITQASRLCRVHLIFGIVKFKVKLVPLPDFFPQAMP